jgi:hypothetical protein
MDGYAGGSHRLLNFTEAGADDTIAEECADVAQLVEQLIRNQQVIGSSPIVGSILRSSYTFSLSFQTSETPLIHRILIRSRLIPLVRFFLLFEAP